MPRPAGARNHDFGEKRLALVDLLTDFALEADLRRPSFRQFAIAANASEPTLRHYFEDRQGVILAILENMGNRGKHIWSLIALPASSQVEAVEQYYRVADAGRRHDLFTRAHAFGLIEGIADEDAGRAYLRYLLEPNLQAIIEKLGATPDSPQTPAALRAAAFAVLAPLLIMSIHQILLGGDKEAPIDSPATFGYLQSWLGSAFAAG
jgi:AcrR family transcriptional regulator